MSFHDPDEENFIREKILGKEENADFSPLAVRVISLEENAESSPFAVRVISLDVIGCSFNSEHYVLSFK